MTTPTNYTVSLLNGKTAQTLKQGNTNTVKAKSGEHYRIVKRQDSSEQLLDNVIAKRTADDLSLTYADGTQVTLENYYIECKAVGSCDVTLPGKEGGVYLLGGEGSSGIALSDDTSMVYAHGNQDVLLGMAQSNTTMYTTLTGIQGNETLYVPAESKGFGLPTLLGILGGAGAVVASGGGGAVASVEKVVASNTVTGTVVAGPVIDGNDLVVNLFKADGTTLLTSGTLKNGSYSFDIGSYTGVVIAKVNSSGTNADYMDEATAQARNLSVNLMALGVATTGTVNINLNALTTIAALKAGVVWSGAPTAVISEQVVLNSNAAVASSFGLLTDLVSSRIVTTINTEGTENVNYTPNVLSNAEKYGAVLAALSGVDSANGGNMQTTIDQVLSGLRVTGNIGSLNAQVLNRVIEGAAKASVTTGHTPENSLTAVISDLIQKTNTSVTIDRVAGDNVITGNELGTVITGTTLLGSKVSLNVGKNEREATVNGTTWTYTLTSEDIKAMALGGETVLANATLSNGTTANATRSIVIATHVQTANNISLAEALKAAADAATKATTDAATTAAENAAAESAAANEAANQLTSDAALAAYNTAKGVVVTDVTTFGTDQTAASSALAAVNNVASATAAVTAAQKLVDDAAKQSTDAAAQAAKASALSSATGATTSTADDAAAATALTDSASATSTAATNVTTAAKALADAQAALTAKTSLLSPKVTNSSASYAATTNTLVLTGTLYSTLLDSTETAGTDIKGRLDWSKLIWDINGDDATTANVGFSLGDISSAKVTSSGVLTVILTTAKAKVLEATTAYGTSPSAADTIDISAGFARDTAGNVATTDAVANAVLTLPTDAVVAADALSSYNLYSALIVPDITDFKDKQISAIVSTAAVVDKTTLATAITKADAFLASAQKLFDDATNEYIAATALGTAAGATVSVADDAAAAIGVSKANTDLATATANLITAQKMKASIDSLTGVYDGNVIKLAATPDMASSVVSGQTGYPNQTNVLFLNSELSVAAIAITDAYFANKTHIQVALVGTTGLESGAGAQSFILGPNYSAMGANSMIASSNSGAIAIDAKATVGSGSFMVNSNSGALAFTTGDQSSAYNGNTQTGQAIIIAGHGNNAINVLTLTGAASVTLGNGNNYLKAETTGPAGAVNLILGTGSNEIDASANGGAVNITTGAGNETIHANTLAGAININIGTVTSGIKSEIVNIDANVGSAGAIVINSSHAKTTINATTFGGGITINTGNGDNTINASTGAGIIIVNTGSGNDHISMNSGSGSGIINAGGGINTIELSPHTTLIDTIVALTADATLVTGATIGIGLADKFMFGVTAAASLASTAETTVSGTTTAAISSTGILSFTGSATHTGANFAAEVLTFLKAAPTTYGKVASFDDGVNQWLFVADSASAGRYIQLVDSHDAAFAGASTTAGAHTILLGA